MEGAAIRERNGLNVALFMAWHAARFVLNGYGNKGKLAGHKSLSDIMFKDEEQQAPKASSAIAFFHNLKARGFPVEITRTELN